MPAIAHQTEQTEESRILPKELASELDVCTEIGGTERKKIMTFLELAGCYSLN